MTLILSAFVGGHVYQLSDRQATTEVGRVWDGSWNKTVVVRTTDALVSISFSGRAVMLGTPMDEWAAETMAGVSPSGGAMLQIHPPASRAGLSRTLKRLMDGLNAGIAAEPSSVPVHAIVVGWRVKGDYVRACHYAVSDLHHLGQVHVHPIRSLRSRRVGLHADPPGWVSPTRLAALGNSLLEVEAPKEREDLLIACIREVANVTQAVGPHVMSIRIPNDTPTPTVRFAPAALHQLVLETRHGSRILPAVHSPAIVTPGVLMLSSMASGPMFDNVGGMDIDWDLPQLPTPEPGPVWSTISSAPRRGWRRRV